MYTSLSSYDEQFHLLMDPSDNDPSVYFRGLHHHLHRQNAGRSFQWFATDQESRFNPEGGYTAQDITYKFNQHGYRCDELTHSPVVFIGCSYTFGVGLKQEETWASLIARKLQIPYINLAFPAVSPHYMLRTLIKSVDELKPKAVMALIPYNYRFEFVSSEPHLPLKNWSKSGITSKTFSGEDRERVYSFELFTRQEHEDFMLMSSLMTMQSFLKARGIHFINSLWEYKERKSSYFQNLLQHSKLENHVVSEIFNGHVRWKDLQLKARDSSHPGRQFHQQFAEVMLRQVECLNIG